VQPSAGTGEKLIGWLHAARRLQSIALVLARHGFGEIVDRVGLYVPRLPGAAPQPGQRARIATRLVEVLTELGPTYLKLGQLLATRADLFPVEVIQALSALHAEVKPLPFREVERTLQRELGRPYQQLFASFATEPLAAASIGQVHRARLHDGSEVVVKVQRPGLRTQVEADLTIMRLFAQLLAQRVPEVAAYRPAELVEVFATSIRMELDFRNEARNADTLGQVLARAPEVHVPRVFPQWTRESVLVMEYVAGARLASVPDAQRPKLRKALLRAFVRQMVEHGVFHADPHPGNLLALADGRVALLDLGAIDVLDERVRGGLFRLGTALLLRRTPALMREVMGLAQVDDTSRVDRAQLERDLTRLLRDAAAGQGSALVGQMLGMSCAHALRLPAPLLTLMRSLAILDGVLRGLDPRADLVRDLRHELAWSSLRRLQHAAHSPLSRWWQRGVERVRALLERAPRLPR
jgi:ubiquinone biosynthesis protein